MPIMSKSPESPGQSLLEKNPTQKVCVVLGSALIMVGLLGVIFPGMLGMHLSMLHNLLHVLTGFLAVWFGLSSPNKAMYFALSSGFFYALAGILGFIVGSPGFPSLGNLASDQNLFKVIPGFLELGTMDHVVHLILGVFLLATVWTFRKERRSPQAS